MPTHLHEMPAKGVKIHYWEEEGGDMVKGPRGKLGPGSTNGDREFHFGDDHVSQRDRRRGGTDNQL